MKTSELIKELEHSLHVNGDLEILFDVDNYGEASVGDTGVYKSESFELDYIEDKTSQWVFAITLRS